jgi:hypothetical protein
MSPYGGYDNFLYDINLTDHTSGKYLIGSSIILVQKIFMTIQSVRQSHTRLMAHTLRTSAIKR